MIANLKALRKKARYSQQEHNLLEKYRALGPSEQKCVDTVVNTLLEKT